MTQGILGFKYKEERHDTGLTGLAGLPVYLDLMKVMRLPDLIGKHLQVKQRGWTDAQMVLSLVRQIVCLFPARSDKSYCYLIVRRFAGGDP